jgi:hypothetical protein
VKELRERTRELESRQRRLAAERDTARGRTEQLERQLAGSCASCRYTTTSCCWAEKNSDEDSGKHSDNSLSQSDPGWLDSSRYKVKWVDEKGYRWVKVLSSSFCHQNYCHHQKIVA